ncbi:MAG: transposase [Gemmatimonadetes bacterium]|nr:transposase [Gemmatimonadota bacterium]
MLRQEHRAGEKVFVDYAGQTVPVVDPETGEIRESQIFVGVLGASNFTPCPKERIRSVQEGPHHARLYPSFVSINLRTSPGMAKE